MGVLETSPERVKRLNGQLTNGKRGNFVITFLQEAPMLTVTNQVTNQITSSSSCVAMASMAQFCYILGPSNLKQKYSSSRFGFENPIYRKNALSSIDLKFHAKPSSVSSSVVCSAANKPSSSSEIRYCSLSSIVILISYS